MPKSYCLECNKEINPHTKRQNYTGLCKECFVKTRTGEKSPWFKRGWLINTQGYKEILLHKEDFFYPMANTYNYVREHRLVVAKSLGRCLHTWESVHHKNGDKLDNRIGNLELTSKNQHMRDHNNGYRDGFEKGLIDGKKEAGKKVVEWGERDCPHVTNPNYLRFKRECPECWKELKKIAGVE